MATKDKAAGGGAAGVIILAVAALGLGFYAGYVVGGKQQWSVGYSAGESAAKRDVAARLTASLGAIPPAEDVKSVTGMIVERSGNTLVIETPQLVRDPFAQPAPTRRSVRLAADTKITIMGSVPQAKLAPLEEEFRKKQDAYLKDLAAGKQATAPVAPSAFESRAGKQDDLAVGEQVTVTAKSGILMAESFDATDVSATPAVKTPTSPAASSGTVPSPDARTPAPAVTTPGAPKTSAGSGTTPTPGATPRPAPAPAPGTPTTNAGTGTR